MGQRKATGRVAILVAVAVLVAGGCRTDRKITRPDPKPVTDELLAGSVLTDTDVPSPFAVDEEAEPLGLEVVPEHECDDPVGQLEPEHSAAATFTSGESTLENTIAHYPGRGAAVGRLYRDLLEDCEQVVVDDAGLSFTAEDLDFGVLSDDTLPILFTIEADDGSIEERNLIVMRAGDLVSTIRLDGPRPSSLETLDAVVRVAIGKLGLLDEDT